MNNKHTGRFARHARTFVQDLTWLSVLAVGFAQIGYAQNVRQLRKAFPVSFTEPVTLDVHLSQGNLHVGYSHDGEVSVTVSVEGMDDANVSDVLSTVSITAIANHVEIRQQSFQPDAHSHLTMTYTLDVPYRTEVHSHIDSGKQALIGIMGPVRAEADTGDIKLSYIANSVNAQTSKGNIDLQVIGGRVDAKVRDGSISCSRASQGLSAETENGDIELMVVGPSTAIVKRGSGRIDAGGVRGSFFATTEMGNIHVKGVPHDDWNLSSSAGSIRVELPPAAAFDVEASTKTGELSVGRNDLDQPAPQAHHLSQKANGGGKRIQLRSEAGKIVIG